MVQHLNNVKVESTDISWSVRGDEAVSQSYALKSIGGHEQGVQGNIVDLDIRHTSNIDLFKISWDYVRTVLLQFLVEEASQYPFWYVCFLPPCF